MAPASNGRQRTYPDDVVTEVIIAAPQNPLLHADAWLKVPASFKNQCILALSNRRLALRG